MVRKAAHSAVDCLNADRRDRKMVGLLALVRGISPNSVLPDGALLRSRAISRFRAENF
jgi:hypothetical protein